MRRLSEARKSENVSMLKGVEIAVKPEAKSGSVNQDLLASSSSFTQAVLFIKQVAMETKQ
jgi:hypothetical protein